MYRIIIIIFLSTSFVYAQDCNVGNEDATDFTDAGPWQPNFLLGTKYTLNSLGTLHSINMIGTNTGAQIQMAVYDDNAGIPNNLIAFTNISTINEGLNSLPVDPIQLEPGDYWIMAIYNIQGIHSFSQAPFDNLTFYNNINFGDNLPVNASAFSSYYARKMTYFLEISCDTLSINGSELNDQLSIFPNPTYSKIHIQKNNLNNYQLKIINALGKTIKTYEIHSKENNIDLSYLVKGIYFLMIKSDSGTQVKKIIKID